MNIFRTLCLLVAALPLLAQEKRPNVAVVVDAERGALVRWAFPSGGFPTAFQVTRSTRGGASQLVATVRPGDRANAPALTAERLRAAQDFLALANDSVKLRGEEAENATFAIRLVAASDPELAAFLGLSCVDRDAPRGETITYVVTRVDGRGVPLPHGMSAPTQIVPVRPPDPPSDFRAEPSRDGVAFYWSRPASNATASDAVTYEIRKSENGRSVLVTPQPVLKLVAAEEEAAGAVDEHPATERTSSYTITALDLFGRRGRESQPLEVFVPDFASLDPPVSVVATASGGKAVVTWEAPSNPNRKGWKVARSTQPKGLGPILTPAPITSSRLVDDAVTAGTTYYYRVTAVNRRDEEGLPRVSAALPMRSAKPPAAPTGLSAEAKTGRVILTWTPSADIVAGYHVERSIGGRDWGLLTSVASAEPRYVDILPPEATGTLQYRVTAWGRDDSPSAPSAVLEVPLPDRRPPETPILQSIDGSGGKVTLRFIPRGGTGDATRYVVLRSGSEDDTGRVVGTGPLGDTATTFADSDVLSGALYFYRLVAVDAAGNRSDPSDPPSSIRVGTPPLPKPPAPSARLETKPFRRVLISIPPSASDSVLYAIERRQGDARWEWIQGPLPATTTQAWDNKPPKHARVSYRLVSMSVDGTPGPASDEVTITTE